MFKRTLFIPILAVLLFPDIAHSAVIYCYGKAERVYISRGSSVVAFMSFRRDYLQVCQLDNSWKGVSTETCKSWYAMLQSAYLAKSEMIVQYSDPTATSCDTIPTYGSAPALGYLMVK